MSQLLKLSHSWQDHEAFYITTSEVLRERLCKSARVYVVGECNREHPVRVLKVLFRCMIKIYKERPNVIISTGAAPGCISSFLAKLLGAKVIWIDSITNIEHLSLSGRIVRHFADLFLVQWLELVEKYKNVEYAGHLIL